MIVERIGAEGAQDWDRYVEAAPGSTLFHRHGWGHAVARTLGHETINLAALRDGRMVGALPLVHKRSRIFGDALISVAFATGGGVLADDPAVAAVLESEALRLGAELHAGHVELRDGAPRGASTLCAPWQVVDSIHAGFRAPIPPDDGTVLRSIPRKGRRHDVKRSLSAGLDFVPDAPFESNGGLISAMSELPKPCFRLIPRYRTTRSWMFRIWIMTKIHPSPSLVIMRSRVGIPRPSRRAWPASTMVAASLARSAPTGGMVKRNSIPLSS